MADFIEVHQNGEPRLVNLGWVEDICPADNGLRVYFIFALPGYAMQEVLHLGPRRAQAFANAYIDAVNAIAKMFAEDGEDDPEMVYSKKVLDDRLRAISGEAFQSWEERYGG